MSTHSLPLDIGPFGISDVVRFAADPEIRAHLEEIFAASHSWDLVHDYCDKIGLDLIVPDDRFNPATSPQAP